MTDLEELAQIYKCIRDNQKYQQTLKGILLDTSNQLNQINTSKRKSQKPYTVNTKKKRRKVQASSCYKFLSDIKKLEDSESRPVTEFTIEQLDLLAASVDRHAMNWVAVAAEMRETVLNCYRNYNLHVVKSKHFIGELSWTQSDDQCLTQAVKKFGSKHWQEVANWVDGKTNSQCYHRWMKTLHPDIKRGKWLAEEDHRLVLATHMYSSNNWASIAEHVPNRTDIQCRERYCNVLNPNLANAYWSSAEKIRLMLAVIVLGKRWSRVARCLQGRTDNQCWRVFKGLCRSPTDRTSADKQLVYLFTAGYFIWASGRKLKVSSALASIGVKLLELRRMYL